MSGDVVGRAVDAECIACFRAHVHRLFGETIECLIVGLHGLPDADLATIEDRNLELNIKTPFTKWSAFRLSGFLVDPRNIEKRDETGCLREVERLCESPQFDAGDLEIDTMCHGVDLDAWQRQWPTRQRRQFLR